MISGLSAWIARLNFPYGMKCFFIQVIVILSLVFYSCSGTTTNTQSKPVVNDSLLTSKDTFLTMDLNESPVYIQAGFNMDSVGMENRKTGSSFSAHFPHLSPHEYPLPYQWLKEIVSDNVKWFKQDIAEGDSLLSRSVDTELLYKDENIVSIVLFESSSAYDRNTDWEPHSYNYDIDRKKEIRMNDYFILKTSADTSFLNHFLDQCVGGGRDIYIPRFDDLSEFFTFAVDSANVYFFFGRYDGFVGFGDFISFVPKKYIMEHINPAYR